MPQDQVSSPGSLDQDVVNLAKAIRQTESGGNPKATGKSGEFGAYQFTEPTWNAAAPKFGINVPLQQSTLEQQNEVAYRLIKQWKDQGYNPGQIASMWNAGGDNPDAYLDPNFKGTNQHGAQFDVPAYAKSVATAYQTIKQGGTPGVDANNPSAVGGFVNPNRTQEAGQQFVQPPPVDMTPVQPLAGEVPKESKLKRFGKGALNLFNAIEEPFVGLAATPVQLLAKAIGAEDPYAEGLPGLFGSRVKVSSLEGGVGKAIERKAGDALQVGSYFVPGGGAVAAAKMGVLQGAGHAMSEGGGLKDVAIGGGVGAGTGLLAAGATKLAGKGIQRVGESLSGERVTKAIQGIKKAYSEALNLHAGERAFETRTGKDLAQVLMEKGASLGRYDNGTLDASDAIQLLQDSLDPLNKEAAKVINEAQGVVGTVDLENVYSTVASRVAKTKVTELEKQAIMNQVEKALNATAKKFGTQLDLPTSDLVKQGFWNTTFKRNITSNDALKGNASYLIGNALKEAEEAVVASTDAGDVLGALNNERSLLVDAIKRLSKLDGVRLIRGGRLGNALGGVTGTLIGHSTGIPVLGPLAGDFFGTEVAKFLNNPANRIAIARGKAGVSGLLPSLLGGAAKPVGTTVEKVGGAVKGLARPAGLISNLLTR